jgi:hypothetical protein
MFCAIQLGDNGPVSAVSVFRVCGDWGRAYEGMRFQYFSGKQTPQAAPGPYKRRYASVADHGQNNLALEKGIPWVILVLLLLQMACAAKSKISWRRFLEYEVSDINVNNSSFSLSFKCQDASFLLFYLQFMFYELQMRDILQWHPFPYLLTIFNPLHLFFYWFAGCKAVWQWSWLLFI